MKKLIKTQGMIFVTSLVMMTLILTLGLISASMVRSEAGSVENMINGLRAFYYAESGVEHLIARIRAKEITPSGGVNEAWGDVDENGPTDYWATIDWATGEITSNYMPPPEVTAQRIVEAKIANFTGALAVVNDFSISAPAGGTIAGNVDASGTISSNIGLYNTTGYTVTANNAGLSLPTPDWTEYANSLNFLLSYNSLTDCSSIGSSPSDGIYYINGDCTINLGGAGPFNLNGTLIVTGNLILQQITGVNIIAQQRLPAIIVGGDFTATSLSSVTIQGLIYAGGTISFTTLAFVTQITGAMVAGNGVNFTNVPNAQINFDTSLNPPFFAGGASGGGAGDTQVVKMTYWKGHP